MLADDEIVRRIRWSVAIAPFASIKRKREDGKIIKERVGKWQISANLDPLKPGDKHVGEAITFRYDAGEQHIIAATSMLQRRIMVSYRKHNETSETAPAAPDESDVRRALMEAWRPS